MADQLTAHDRRRAVVPIDTLTPNPRNPRNHPASQLKHYMAAVELFGQMRPVLVRASNHMIVAGHGLWMAMGKLGRSQIEVEFIDCDQATADAYMEAENRIAKLATDTPIKIRELLDSMDEDWRFAVGYDEDDYKLIAPKDDEELEVSQIDTTQLYDEFWCIVRGPLAEQAEVLQLLNKLTQDRPSILIEIGTTSRD